MSKHGQIGRAALKADMGRETARKYATAGKLPSEIAAPRDWRTRPDPFEEHWPEVEQRLAETPALEAKTLFEWLTEKYPGRYEPGQLRTLRRHVRVWRAERGPDKVAVLAQAHRPGEAAQTDLTWAKELAITIAGQVFVREERVKVGEWSTVRVKGCAYSVTETARAAIREAPDEGDLAEPLTDREREVLRLVAAGMNSARSRTRSASRRAR